jgi:hypothetical protein
LGLRGRSGRNQEKETDMPWPWEPDKKKPAFPPPAENPVVRQKPVEKTSFVKKISGKTQRNRMDDAIKNSGG